MSQGNQKQKLDPSSKLPASGSPSASPGREGTDASESPGGAGADAGSDLETQI